MEVLGVDNLSNGITKSAIVRMDSNDLCRLLYADPAALPKLTIGSQIRICSRFDHYVKVESAVKDAVGMPAKLRVLADLLEMHHPVLTEIFTDKTEFGA